MSLTDAGAFTFDVNLNDDAPAFHYVGAARALITATGSKTFTYAFSVTATEGPVLALFFVDEIDTGDWIRDSDGARTAATTAISLTVDSAATDIVVSLDGRAVATAPSAVSGWTSQGSGTFNGIGYRAASADSPGSTTTTFNAADENYSGAAVVSIKQTAGGGTVNEPKTLSRRNRPGRGPYSKGRYLRPSLNTYAVALAPVTGSLTSTFGALTAVANATLLIQGSGTNTLEALTAAANAALLVQGSGASTLAALTLAGTGVSDARGTLSATLGALAATASNGDLLIQGTAGITLAAATATASNGDLLIQGTGALTLGALTLSGVGAANPLSSETGLSRRNRPGRGPYSQERYFRPSLYAYTAANTRAGALAKTLADLTASASNGDLLIQGALGVTLDALNVSGVGALPGQGALASTLGALSLTSLGTANADGTLSVTLDAATLLATGGSDRSGSASITLADATAVGAGDLPIVGALSVTLQSVLIFAVGSETGASAAGAFGARSPIVQVGRMLS